MFLKFTDFWSIEFEFEFGFEIFNFKNQNASYTMPSHFSPFLGGVRWPKEFRSLMNTHYYFRSFKNNHIHFRSLASSYAEYWALLIQGTLTLAFFGGSKTGDKAPIFYYWLCMRRERDTPEILSCKNKSNKHGKADQETVGLLSFHSKL